MIRTQHHLLMESHPARGAWIEILSVTVRTPSVYVAPRKGCVD